MDTLKTIWKNNNMIKASNFTNSIQTFITNGIILLLNLSTGIITARYLGVEGRGSQAAMIMLPQFLAYTVTLGLPSSIIYNYSKYKLKSKELISVSILWTIIIGVFSSIIGYFIIPVLLENYSGDVIRFAQYAIFLTPIGLMSTICIPILKINNNYRLFNRLRYLLPAMTLLILLLLISFNYNNPYTFAIAYLLPSVPLTVWLFKEINKVHGFQLKNFGENSKILFSYGIRAYGIDVIGTLYKNINQILITVLFSPFYLGLYIISTSISSMLNIFQNSVVEVLFPSTAGKHKNTVISIASRSARISNYLTFIIAIILISIAPILIEILYGEEFLQATNLLRVLLLGILVSSSNWILSQSFLSLNKPGVVTILQCVGILITIPLFISLVNQYGILGAGVAILISNIVRLVLTLICYKLVLNVKVPNIIFDHKDIDYIRKKIGKKIIHEDGSE